MSRLRPPVLIALVGLALSACGSPNPDVSIGIRSMALGLQFAKPELAKPIAPNVIIKYIPAPPGVTVPLLPQYQSPPGSVPVVVPPSAPDYCPVAAFDAVPKENVARAPKAPPVAGVYAFASKGATKVTGGTTELTVPIPKDTSVSFSPSRRVDPDATSAAAAPAQVPEFTMTTALSPTYTQTDTLRENETGIVLVKRVIKDASRTLTFNPTPPVTFYQYGAEKDSWNSAGVDLDTGAALLISGLIGQRVRVDVCGELVDTYTVTLTEQFADVQTGETIETSPTDMNTFQMAPQFGGLIVKRHVNVTDTRTDRATGSQATVNLAYDSLLTSTTPSPLPRSSP